MKSSIKVLILSVVVTVGASLLSCSKNESPTKSLQHTKDTIHMHITAVDEVEVDDPPTPPLVKESKK